MPDHAEFNWRDTIDRGLYPVSTVARLTGAQPANIANWVRGRASMKPIIIRQYPDAGAKAVLGFLDLIDVLFVAHFRKLGLSLQSIRKVAAKLRARHGTDHPFATQRFRTDGKAIFAEEVDTNEERRILNLMNDNFELGEIIKRSLFEDLFYVGDIAARWRPNPDMPRVLVDPKVAFGMPAIEGKGVPTAALYDAWLAEEGSLAAVADAYCLDVKDVEQAVKFEYNLGHPTA
jgi:uncharacterized protein (DUF433 family)